MKAKGTLVGMFFHTWKKDEDDIYRIENQGIILKAVEAEMLLVQIFSFTPGAPSEKRAYYAAAPADTVYEKGWSLYDTMEEMQAAFMSLKGVV